MTFSILRAMAFRSSPSKPLVRVWYTQVQHNEENGKNKQRSCMRDDFKPSVKRTIALRVGYHCSNPTCGAKTTGPQIDPAKAINIGVAAHITAASPGGPRYRPTASEAARTSPENGLWLCQNCAKLIDNDVARFPEVLLRHWKQIAELRTLQQLGRQSPFDRTDAPALEIPSSGSCRLTAPLTEPLSAESIRRLCALLPREARDVEQVELLGSGRGAMDQRYAIIGAGINHGWDWTIGLFTAGEFGWELVASIRLDNQKAWVPEAVYVPGTPGALVVTHVHGWGTGMFRRSTSWYRIVKGEPSPLLSYPHDFYVVGWGMAFGRRLKSAALHMPLHLTNGAPLELRFDVDYTMEDSGACEESEKNLFSLTETLSLEWNDTASVFVPRTPSDDFARIEEIWVEGTERFVEHNSERLRHLGQHGTPRQRSFVSVHCSQ
jgi:hypothetical protein